MENPAVDPVVDIKGIFYSFIMRLSVIELFYVVWETLSSQPSTSKGGFISKTKLLNFKGTTRSGLIKENTNDDDVCWLLVFIWS